MEQRESRNISIVKQIFGWRSWPLNTRSVFAYSASRMDIEMTRLELRPCKTRVLSAPLRSARRRAVCNAAAACCGDVSSWHIADIDADDEHVGFWG